MQHSRLLRRTARARSRPEFHQLAIFLKVTETRSFAATARQLGCTQPAISQAIARLEDIYGGNLFERRRGAPLGLTPIGEAILPSARTLLYTVDQQMTSAAQTAQSHVGRLTLGFQAGLSAGPLRPGVADFIKASPAVRLRMVEAQPGDLLRQLEKRAVDLLVVAMTPDPADPRLGREKLWDERLFVALSAAHILAARADLDWPTIASVRLILSGSSDALDPFQSIIARLANCQLDCEQHAVSHDVLLDMVGLGIGGSIVFGSAAAPHAGVVFRPIVGDDASVAIHAIWRDHDGNPLRHRLLKHLRGQRDLHSDPSFNGHRPATAPGSDRG